MGNIPEFKYTENNYPIDYPFGTHFRGAYIEEISKIISNHFNPDDKIQLIARGSSGVLIGSAILQEFYNKKYTQSILLVINRKPEENSHAGNLEDIEYYDGVKIVVVDDFISTGNTIKYILDDLDTFLCIPSDRGVVKLKYNMLCVGNCLLPSFCKKNKNKNWEVYKYIYKRFDCIVCCPTQTILK